MTPIRATHTLQYSCKIQQAPTDPQWTRPLAFPHVGHPTSIRSRDSIGRHDDVQGKLDHRPLAASPERATALLILTMIGVPAGLAQQPPVARPLPVPGATQKATAGAATQLFERNNLIAWCIVPFDSKKRGPEERAVMLQKLGFKHFAYDWRTEHISTFDAEVEALDRHGIGLDAFWVAPGELNRESRIILDLLKRHGKKAQLWVLLDLGNDRVQGAEQERRVKAAAEKLRPLAEEAGKIGCSLALYNHGGWFGEPENQIAIIERLKGQGVTNLGIVYNLHHGHDHLDRFAEVLTKLMPYLAALNINGMDPGGDRAGRKILPLGQGSRDLELLRTIAASGYKGPIGILGHTQDDAEERLKDNLDGLDWLVPQLDGHPAGKRPSRALPCPLQLPRRSSRPMCPPLPRFRARQRHLMIRLLSPR